MLARQVREATDRWDAEQDLHLEQLRALLPDDPAAAVRRLKLCAAGCRWLIRRWEDLLGTLLRRGAWAAADRDEAIRLLGLRPEAGRLAESPQAYRLRLYNLLVSEEATEEALQWLLDPRLMPGSLRGTYDAGGLPDDEECRRWLSWTCEAQLEQLRDLEARLQSGIDGPDRAEATARATILQDPVEARLFLRYHAESRTAFHRHYAQLVKTLERDAGAEGGAPAAAPSEPDDAPADSQNEPEAAPERGAPPDEPAGAAVADSPNEPEAAPLPAGPCPAVSPNEPGEDSPVTPGPWFAPAASGPR
jgi:hypothetical protein